MKTKKLLSTLLAISVSISTLAAATITASADGDTPARKTMNIGGSVIANGDPANSKWDYIYYGDAKKWRVLSTNGNTTADETVSFSDGAKTVSSDKTLFVISENDFGKRAFNSNNNQNWQNSEAQTWCKDTLLKSFANAEQNAILQTSKSESGQ